MLCLVSGWLWLLLCNWQKRLRLTGPSGLQPRAVQGMLDFDFICKRKQPSVAGIIYTFGGQFVSKMYVLPPQ